MAGTFVFLALLLLALLAAGFWVGLALLLVGMAGLWMLGAANAGGLVASTARANSRTFSRPTR